MPCGLQFRPGLAAVGRQVHVVAKKREVNVRLKTEIEEIPYLIGACHRVTAEYARFQDTGECPGDAGVGGESPAGLPEVGGNSIELPPTDCHLITVRRINGNHALVSGVAEDVIPICIDVYLITDE